MDQLSKSLDGAKLKNGMGSEDIRLWLNRCNADIRNILTLKKQQTSTQSLKTSNETKVSTQHQISAENNTKQVLNNQNQINQSPTSPSPTSSINIPTTNISTPVPVSSVKTCVPAQTQPQISPSLLSTPTSTPTSANPPPNNPLQCNNQRCLTLFSRFTSLCQSSEKLHKQYLKLKDEHAECEMKKGGGKSQDDISLLQEKYNTNISTLQAKLHEYNKVSDQQKAIISNLERELTQIRQSFDSIASDNQKYKDELVGKEKQIQNYQNTVQNLQNIQSSYNTTNNLHTQRPLKRHISNTYSYDNDNDNDIDNINNSNINSLYNTASNNNSGNDIVDDNNIPSASSQTSGFVSAAIKLRQERKEKGLNPNAFSNTSTNHGNGNNTGANGNTIPPRQVAKFIPPYKNNIKNLNNNNNNNNNDSSFQKSLAASGAPGPLRRAFANPANTTSNNNNTNNNGANANDDETPKTGPGGIPLDENGKMPGRLGGCEPALVETILNDMLDGTPGVRWADIAGLEFAKKNVVEIVVWPMLRPDLFRGLRGPPKGMMLFGPPGTGKTLIGKAIATESHAKFFSISASSLTSKWHGQGEKLVRALFAVAEYFEPSVIFIDEIDSLLSQRQDAEFEASRRIKTEFLVQLDGVGTTITLEDGTVKEPRILIVGATNRPHELDEAARRRLVKRLYVPLPDTKARLQLIRHLIDKENHSILDDEFTTIVEKTDGYSGADLKALCAEAAMGPLRDLTSDILNINTSDVRPISSNDFIEALSLVRASVDSKDLDALEKWNELYGSFPMDPKTK